MKLKSDDFKNFNFKDFKCLVEKQLENKMCFLRSNCGGEHFSNEFLDFLNNQGI